MTGRATSNKSVALTQKFMSPSTPRDHSVTIAKAIAIILMVMGHAGCPPVVNSYLQLMRMPLFFFMSGYCFKVTYLDDPSAYLFKRVKGVYWPYVKWGVVFVLLHNVFMHLSLYTDGFSYHGDAIYHYDAYETGHRLLDILLMVRTEHMIMGFWFLKALFWGSCIFFLVRSVIGNAYLGALLLLCLTIISSKFHWLVPVLGLDALDLFAAFFIMTGHIFRHAQLRGGLIVYRIINNWWLLLIFAICIGVMSIYSPASMLYFNWSQVIPFACVATMGSLIIFAIGSWVNHWRTVSASKLVAISKDGLRRFLIYTGGYTFNVLTWHFLSFKIVSLFIIAVAGLQYARVGDFPVIREYAHQGLWALYWIVGVTVPVAGTYLRDWILHRAKKK